MLNQCVNQFMNKSVYQPAVGRPRLPLKNRGFSLVELMVVVAIVGILASIAVPAYRNYVIETGRSEPQVMLMDAHNRQQQYMLDNRVYAPTMGALYGTADATMETKTGNYVVSVVTDPDGFSYTLTAIPPSGSSQESDGPLGLSSLGEKTPEDKWL